MAVRRVTISVRDGVFVEIRLEQTTATPALCACPMRAGSPSRFGKNSMSSRSAQPLTQTVPQKSAYCCGVREASPPLLWCERSRAGAFRPALLADRTAPASVRQHPEHQKASRPATRCSRPSARTAAWPHGEYRPLCGRRWQDDFRTACADAAAADGDAGHDNYLTAKKIFSSYGLPRRLSSLPEQKSKASRFLWKFALAG